MTGESGIVEFSEGDLADMAADRAEAFGMFDSPPDALPPEQLGRPHSEYGRCPLGDECPCWQEGHREAAPLWRAQRDLLAEALGKVLVASGTITDAPMTGPELLAHAASLAEELSEYGRTSDVRQEPSESNRTDSGHR